MQHPKLPEWVKTITIYTPFLLVLLLTQHHLRFPPKTWHKLNHSDSAQIVPSCVCFSMKGKHGYCDLKKTNFDQWCSSGAHFQAHTDFFYMVLICLIIARKTRSLDFHNIDQTLSFCETVKFYKFEVLCLLFRGRTWVVLPAPSLIDTPAVWGLPLHWKHRVYEGGYQTHPPSAQANKPPVTALWGNSKTNQAANLQQCLFHVSRLKGI